MSSSRSWAAREPPPTLCVGHVPASAHQAAVAPGRPRIATTGRLSLGRCLRRQRSPLRATEDRHTPAGKVHSVTNQLRSPSGATEDRDIFTVFVNDVVPQRWPCEETEVRYAFYIDATRSGAPLRRPLDDLGQQRAWVPVRTSLTMEPAAAR